MRDETARVDDALGNPLAVEVADLLEEVVVLEGRRASVTDRPLVLVVVDGVALARRQVTAVVVLTHRVLPLVESGMLSSIPTWLQPMDVPPG